MLRDCASENAVRVQVKCSKCSKSILPFFLSLKPLPRAKRGKASLLASVFTSFLACFFLSLVWFFLFLSFLLRWLHFLCESLQIKRVSGVSEVVEANVSVVRVWEKLKCARRKTELAQKRRHKDAHGLSKSGRRS